MKPVLVAVQQSGITLYEMGFPIADGRTVLAQVFPYDGSLRYRYLVRTPAVNEGEAPTENEYFSHYSHPAAQEAWEAMPEAERGPAPQAFSASDLQYYLESLTHVRQEFQHYFWLPVPGQEITLFPAPEAKVNTSQLPDLDDDEDTDDEDDSED